LCKYFLGRLAFWSQDHFFPKKWFFRVFRGCWFTEFFPKCRSASFLPFVRGGLRVQTGKMVDRINRAHGLHWVGKEELADAMEGNQCDGPTNSTDWRLVERGVQQE
jgi:hypothetical protein